MGINPVTLSPFCSGIGSFEVSATAADLQSAKGQELQERVGEVARTILEQVSFLSLLSMSTYSPEQVYFVEFLTACHVQLYYIVESFNVLTLFLVCLVLPVRPLDSNINSKQSKQFTNHENTLPIYHIV